MKIENSEFQYVENVIVAAAEGDWPKFKALAQDKFSNEQTMHEHFDVITGVLRQWGDNADICITGPVKFRGDRLLCVEIRHGNGSDLPISLTVRNTRRDGVNNSFEIAGFFQEVDMSWVYE